MKINVSVRPAASPRMVVRKINFGINRYVLVRHAKLQLQDVEKIKDGIKVNVSVSVNNDNLILCVL